MTPSPRQRNVLWKLKTETSTARTKTSNRNDQKNQQNETLPQSDTGMSSPRCCREWISHRSQSVDNELPRPSSPLWLAQGNTENSNTSSSKRRSKATNIRAPWSRPPSPEPICNSDAPPSQTRNPNIRARKEGTVYTLQWSVHPRYFLDISH